MISLFPAKVTALLTLEEDRVVVVAAPFPKRTLKGRV